MAIYIEIIKSSDDDSFVYYNYGFTIPFKKINTAKGKVRNELKVVVGELKIDKKNGEIYVIRLAEGDEARFYAERACSVLKSHWKKGEFPDKTFRAS